MNLDASMDKIKTALPRSEEWEVQVRATLSHTTLIRTIGVR